MLIEALFLWGLCLLFLRQSRCWGGLMEVCVALYKRERERERGEREEREREIYAHRGPIPVGPLPPLPETESLMGWFNGGLCF